MDEQLLEIHIRFYLENNDKLLKLHQHFYWAESQLSCGFSLNNCAI